METKPNHRPPKERTIESGKIEKEFYTTNEVADLLGFHYNTIRRMIKAGELKAVKCGREWRIRKEDLKEFTTP